MKVLIGMAAGTQLDHFKGRAAGFHFEAVGDVNEHVIETVFLVAVGASLQNLLRGYFLPRRIQVVHMTVYTVGLDGGNLRGIIGFDAVYALHECIRGFPVGKFCSRKRLPALQVAHLGAVHLFRFWVGDLFNIVVAVNT